MIREGNLNAIEVNHLRRIFTPTVGVLRRTKKEVVAVNDISFDVRPGELFGLLGPNGAGKTTTVKMLTTLLIPTSGTAYINGLDVVEQAELLRSRIGFIFGGERGLYWRLSATDNLRYFASLYNVDPEVAKKRIPQLLEMVGLAGRGNEKIEGYSRGMKQRLHIARTLLHNPDVLFLDEPTIGLDPVGARELRAIVRNLQAEKKTILLTTHYMFEADELCQRIGVINHGHIVALDTPAALKSVVRDLAVIELEVSGLDANGIERLKALHGVETVTVEDQDEKQQVLVHSPRGSEAVPDLLTALNGVPVNKVIVREPTLEDAYVRLVGRVGDGVDADKKESEGVA
ncbi:MAG: ABC transporter ATP-binding protein [Anaerolineae bacterium]|nr:ABC transporter ATP-binding protein [Anaerolineae bacterium]